MFSQLQGQRPQIHPNQPSSPLYQHQTRNLHVESASEPVAAPRNQIEAMPPSKIMPEPVKIPQMPMQPVFNPATMHPVFMGNFRKAPFPLPMNGGLNPVATGYVFARDRVNGNTKL